MLVFMTEWKIITKEKRNLFRVTQLPSFPPVTCTGYCKKTKQNWCLAEEADQRGGRSFAEVSR
jgi:hypothetical protein